MTRSETLTEDDLAPSRASWDSRREMPKRPEGRARARAAWTPT